MRKGEDFVKFALKSCSESVLERLGGAWEEFRRGSGGGFGGGGLGRIVGLPMLI